MRELLEQAVTELLGVGQASATALAAEDNLSLLSGVLGPSGSNAPTSSVPDLTVRRQFNRRVSVVT